MPYPAGHRAAIRGKIVDSARRLFNQHGFDNVTVKQIMAGAGLTHGGFYDYFKGKSSLYTEVLGCFFTDPNWQRRWKGVHLDLQADDAGKQIIRAYLSRAHFEDIENSCPMVALPTDVQRNGKAVQNAFETVFRAMVEAIEQSVRGKRSARRQRAQAIAALCIGGLIVARTVRTERIADELREACMGVALEILDAAMSSSR
jgi:TetR/AcrR family transcriptional regulator, transcriptional repressor for nem operon